MRNLGIEVEEPLVDRINLEKLVELVFINYQSNIFSVELDKCSLLRQIICVFFMIKDVCALINHVISIFVMVLKLNKILFTWLEFSLLLRGRLMQVFTFEIFVVESIVISIRRKLGVMEILVIVAHSFHIFWRVDYIRIMRRRSIFTIYFVNVMRSSLLLSIISLKVLMVESIVVSIRSKLRIVKFFMVISYPLHIFRGINHIWIMR